MKITLQVLILFGICLIAEAVSQFLPFTFPSSVMAMVILLLFLLIRLVKPEHINHISDFLIKNMPFFFIPAGVKIIDNFEYIKDCYIALFVIALITFLITFSSCI